MRAYIVPHNRKGLVGPVAWVAVPAGGRTSLMSGCGTEMETGMPMLGIIWPMGAIGVMPPIRPMPTTPAGGREDKGMGSLLLCARLPYPWPERPIMGLTLIWLRVGGCGWFTWNGLT